MKFSEKSMEVIESAKDLAMRMDGIVGTEHLLYGLIVADSKMRLLLAKNGFRAAYMTHYLQCRSQPVIQEHVAMSARADFVLKASQDIAKMMASDEVDSCHILYAILEQEDSIAMNLINAANVDVNALKARVYQSARLDLYLRLNLYLRKKVDDTSGENKEISKFNENHASTLESLQSSTVSDKHISLAELMKDDTYKEGNRRIRGNGFLSKYGVDMTQRAREGKLDPVIGRGVETERVIQVLCRRTKNNPILIGEPGVGKSAVVDGLAQAIAEGNVPDILKDKTLFSLDLTSLVAGTRYRGDFEERIKNVMNEVAQRGDIILFIDEIHTMLDVGSSEGGMSAANILKPMLARGELQAIGATTTEEFRKYFEKDSALERRFQPIAVEEPTISETIEILYGLREKYEQHHGVSISDAAISAAAVMADRYVTDRFLPDKAIDLIDEAAARKSIFGFTTPQSMRELEAKMKQAEFELGDAMRKENYDKCAKLKDVRDDYMMQIMQAKADWENIRNCASSTVEENDVAEVVSSWTGVPVRRITDGESEKLAALEQYLKGRVIGQDSACSAVAMAVKRARAGLSDPKRPIGSFVFLGPTGVGKTELARALAGALFGDDDMLIRVDMSEYMEKENVSRLIGSAPGLVGFDEGGQLTEKVRRKPYSVVLFDEIEKGHQDIYNLLLQILEDGILTDSHGRTVSFKNTVVILTSNIGAKEARVQVGFIGDESTASESERMKEKHIAALKNYMKPELINRIDETIVFEKLGRDSLVKIADLMFSSLAKRLDGHGIGMEISDAARMYVVDKGYDSQYGARPLRRTIQRLVEDKLSEKLISGELCEGDTLYIGTDEYGLTFGKK